MTHQVNTSPNLIMISLIPARHAFEEIRNFSFVKSDIL